MYRYEHGQMVVCIGTEGFEYLEQKPMLKGIYELREIGKFNGELAFLLVGIYNCYTNSLGVNMETGFWAKNFQPVRKTNISSFHEILAEVNNENLEKQH
jgi:hypothetical protein